VLHHGVDLHAVIRNCCNAKQLQRFVVLISAWLASIAVAQESSTALSGQVELARLVDLCAQRLGLRIEYDATALKGEVTLRLPDGLSDEQLWALTNYLLASRGFTTVRAPGTPGTPGRPGSPGPGQDIISIVKLADAPGSAAIARWPARPEEEAADRVGTPGYVSIVIRPAHQSTKTVVDALKLILSKSGGVATELGATGFILISDLEPRIEEALHLVELIDVPAAQPVIEKVSLRFASATSIAALITAATATRDAAAPGLAAASRSRVIASPDGDSVILVCPRESEEADFLRGLIAKFDEREPAVTRTYTPRHFGIVEVAKLIEQAIHGRAQLTAPQTEWNLVTDELTGSLIITALPGEHERIVALMQRLDSVPIEARRPLRSFVIRNRNVNEILDVVSKLIDQGVLEAADGEDSAAVTTAAAAQRSPPSTPAPASVPAPIIVTGETIVPPPPVSAPPPPPEVEINAPAPADRAGNDRTPTTPQTRGRQVDRGLPSLILSADEGTNTLIAVGDPRKLEQLGALIRQLDVRQPQVMLEVLVISLSESDTLDLGVELEKLEINGTTLISLTSLFGLTPGSGGDTADPKIPRGRGFTGVVLNPGDFSVVIRALETLNKGRTLNMPKVLVNNNQQATLNAVLQQPFASTNASTTVATTSFGGTQDAGTTVTVKPQIAEGDHLILEYSVALSAFVGESDDPSLPPPRQTNNLSSIVTIPDGYTVVVGGLEITTLADAVSQVPLLGDVPWLGELFKTRSKSTSRSRFFVFIRSDVLRNTGFEDLKYLSDQDATAAVIPEAFRGWPEVEPRIIR
jgi:general secretion pathway protein D